MCITREKYQVTIGNLGSVIRQQKSHSSLQNVRLDLQ